MDFSSEVEAELFEQHSEYDRGNRAPKAKYLGKFRSLIYNLKTNEAFRLQVGSGALDPSKIVNMSMEDLLTPELRAMAENIRARSLKDSVKQVVEAPRIRRTHKGEEVLDEFATTDTSVKETGAQQDPMRASTSSMHMEPQSPRLQNDGFATHHRSPSVSMPPPDDLGRSPNRRLSSSQSQRPRMPSLTASFLVSATELGLEEEETNIMDQLIVSEPNSIPGTPSLRADEAASTTPRAEDERDSPSSKAKFDFASIWGSFNSPVVEGKDAQPEEGKVADEGEEDYDPFAGVPPSAMDEDVDMELEELFKGAGEAPVTTTPPGSPPQVNAMKKSEFIRSFAPVWLGDVLMPEEGGYPSVAVQVAGRPLPSTEDVWKSILPQALHMQGRIATKTASDYLVQCAFAATRELVVIALLPDLSGPTAQKPEKPDGGAGTAKQNHLLQFLSKKSRFGVCPPSEPLKRIVKDIYIVPLLAKDPLPEYIELLDQHALGESGERDTDLLLAVMVMVKGAIPSAGHPSMAPPSIQAIPPAPMQQMTPPPSIGLPPPVPAGFPSLPQGFAPSLPPPNLSEIDPVALQGLLSQPGALQNLLSNNNQAAAGLMNNPNLMPALNSNAGLMANFVADPNLLQTLLAAVPGGAQQNGGYPPYDQSMPPPGNYGRGGYNDQDWNRRSPPRNRSRSPPPRRQSRGYRDERDEYDNRGFNGGRDSRDSGRGPRGRDGGPKRGFEPRERDSGWGRR